jgi:hypothetical protein
MFKRLMKPLSFFSRKRPTVDDLTDEEKEAYTAVCQQFGPQWAERYFLPVLIRMRQLPDPPETEPPATMLAVLLLMKEHLDRDPTLKELEQAFEEIEHGDEWSIPAD